MQNYLYITKWNISIQSKLINTVVLLHPRPKIKILNNKIKTHLINTHLLIILLLLKSNNKTYGYALHTLFLNSWQKRRSWTFDGGVSCPWQILSYLLNGNSLDMINSPTYYFRSTVQIVPSTRFRFISSVFATLVILIVYS